MSDAMSDADRRIEELRRDFDRAFAEPYPDEPEEVESLLAIRLQEDPYGLIVGEIAAVDRAGSIVPLPSRSPGLIGIAGFRGAILPVYGLASLLGYERSPESPRWLVVCGKREPLALAVSELEGYVQVPKGSLHPPDREARKHVQGFARIGETVRAVVSVPSILEAIQGVH